jgi:hypothetical protein
MGMNEIIKIIVEGAAVSGVIGSLVTVYLTWRFRKEIKRGEKRRAAMKLSEQYYRHYRRAADCEEASKPEHEQVLAGGGRA